MLNLPVLRWGKPYDSMETDQVVHFLTGEPIAKVSQANGGLLQRDMRFAQRARDVLPLISGLGFLISPLLVGLCAGASVSVWRALKDEPALDIAV